MNRRTEQPTITPELAAEYQRHVQRHESCGLDVGETLDNYAKKNRKQLRRLGIRYPQSGSVQERWLALRKAFAENRLKDDEKKLGDLLEKVRADLEELDMGRAPLSGVNLNPDEIEQVLAEAEMGNPELELLATQIRETVQEAWERIQDLR
jgi:hypothetical protein